MCKDQITTDGLSHHSKTPVMYELYDEIVFTNPKPSFKQCLMNYQKHLLPIKTVMSVGSRYLKNKLNEFAKICLTNHTK